MNKIITLLGLCLFSVPAALADANPLPPGQWLPFHGEDRSIWQENVKEDPAFPVTRKDLDRTLGKLAEIHDEFRRVPALGSPAGFDVRPLRRIDLPSAKTVGAARFKRSARPFASSSRLQLFVPSVQAAHEAAGRFVIDINNIRKVFFSHRGPPYARDDRGEMFVEPRVVARHDGFHEYHTGYVVLKSNSRPLWVPVSIERVLGHEIRQAADTLKKLESNAPASGGSDRNKAMQENHEKSLQGIEGMRPMLGDEKADKMKRDMRREFKKLMAALKVQQPKMDRIANAGLDLSRDRLQALQQMLQALTPKQRAAPAWLQKQIIPPASKAFRKKWGKKLMLPNVSHQKGLARIVEINRDYFSAALPRSAFQLITVRRNTSYLTKTGERILRPAQDSVWKTLDWRRVAGIMDR